MKYEIKKIAGIDCIFAPMQDCNSVTIQVLAKAWNVYETREINWLSHFLEHMFFKWGKKYETPKKVAETVDKFWWQFNAFTTWEYAGYYVKCAYDNLNIAIDVLADMIVNPVFPKEEMEREKWVVIQEIKMYEDNPASLVYDKWSNFYFWDNSYGWGTLWLEENIKSFSQEDLFNHKNNLYTKDNLVIVVAGNIKDENAIEEQIWTLFWDLPWNTKISKPKFEWILPNVKQDFYDKGTEQNHLIISANWVKRGAEWEFESKILSTILWGNMSSRLFQNVREKQGLCYYISARHWNVRDYWIFMIRAGLDKERFEFGKEKIFEEIQNINKNEIFQEEFENAVWYVIWSLQMGIETPDDMADFLGSQYLLYGEIRDLNYLTEQYKNVTLDSIKKIQTKLDKDNLYSYWIQ